MSKRGALWPLFTQPAPTLHTNSWVTVTHPPALGTVVSVQPDGGVQLAPQGTQGPAVTGLLKPDRIVYAPHGADGAVYLLPYAGEALPNT